MWRLSVRLPSSVEQGFAMFVKGCPIVNAPVLVGFLGEYNLGVVTPRALVHAGDKTRRDARIVQLFEILTHRLDFLQTYKLTYIIVDVFKYHFQVCFDKGKWMVLEIKDVYPWGFGI
ncbi:hypothetical protein Tco_0247327 [Tanacetum coccineum]